MVEDAELMEEDLKKKQELESLLVPISEHTTITDILKRLKRDGIEVKISIINETAAYNILEVYADGLALTRSKEVMDKVVRDYMLYRNNERSTYLLNTLILHKKTT